MKLKNLLTEKKDAILDRWFDLILDTYPPDTSNFLKTQKNRFANPVGAAISQGIENLFDELMHETGSGQAASFLDGIVRVRAIQDFSPSQAVAFVFLLKKVIREIVEKEKNEGRFADDIVELESKIDDMALLAFDIYMKCREKLYDIKANELRRMTFRLLQRANLICEIPGQEADGSQE